NSILDATGGGTKFLHAAYLRGGVSNMTFNNVQFKNTPGGGIHIYNSRAELAAPRDIVFNNCSIDNTRAAVYLYSNASNISFNNLSIKNSGVGFKVNGANNIKMNGVNLTQASSTKEEKGGFSLNNLKYAQLNNVTVDGSGMAGSVFAVIGSVSDVIATNFNATNIGGIPFTNNSSAVKSMTAVNLAISSSYSTGYKILAQ
ncbi:MAG TPA: hypothetical protein VLS94_12395, partial [Fusibacter sp.]|nr:hypothetical protein [Fusibacter sp.]